MRTWLVALLLLGIGTAGAMNVWNQRAARRDADTTAALDDSAVTVDDDGTSEPDESAFDALTVTEDATVSGEDAAKGDAAAPDAPKGGDSPSATEADATAAIRAADESTDHESKDIAERGDPSDPGHDDRPGGATILAEGEAKRQALSLVEQASKSTNPVEQSRLLTQALQSGALDRDADEKVYQALLDANRRGLFNPRVADLCYELAVEKGDSLWTICRRAAKEGHAPVTPGLVRLLNGMANDHLRAGARLKLPNVAVSVLVEKPKYRLSVMLGDILLKRYLVGLGKDNKTPEGDFLIKTRLIDPPWFKPGEGEIPAGHPENVLGTRWLGFAEKDGFPEAATFGIHGTREDDSIGTQSSNGCVRMHNADVEELFEWIGEGVKVTIRP